MTALLSYLFCVVAFFLPLNSHASEKEALMQKIKQVHQIRIEAGFTKADPLADMRINSSDYATFENFERLYNTTKGQLSETAVYQRKMDILNEHRKQSGLKPLDTTNNEKYNIDFKHFLNKLENIAK